MVFHNMSSKAEHSQFVLWLLNCFQMLYSHLIGSELSTVIFGSQSTKNLVLNGSVCFSTAEEMTLWSFSSNNMKMKWHDVINRGFCNCAITAMIWFAHCLNCSLLFSSWSRHINCLVSSSCSGHVQTAVWMEPFTKHIPSYTGEGSASKPPHCCY